MEESNELSNRILLGGAAGFMSLAAFLVVGTFAENTFGELPARLALSGPFVLAAFAVAATDRWYMKRRRKERSRTGAQ